MSLKNGLFNYNAEWLYTPQRITLLTEGKIYSVVGEGGLSLAFSCHLHSAIHTFFPQRPFQCDSWILCHSWPCLLKYTPQPLQFLRGACGWEVKAGVIILKTISANFLSDEASRDICGPESPVIRLYVALAAQVRSRARILCSNHWKFWYLEPGTEIVKMLHTPYQFTSIKKSSLKWDI